MARHPLRNLDGAPLFESNRLVVRRWLPSDVNAIFEVYSDPDVARWIGDSSPITQEQSRAWLGVTNSNYVQRGYGMFAIQDKETGDIAGFVGLVHPDGQDDAEIKYAFCQSHWGRGFASEVVAATVSYVSNTLHLPKIIATVAPKNRASQRVLEKADFVFVRERKDEDGDTEYYYEWPCPNATN